MSEMEIPTLSNSEQPNQQPSISNFTEDAILRQSVSLPFNFNVFISNIISDLILPVNGTGPNSAIVRQSLHNSRLSTTTNNSSDFNTSKSTNLNYSLDQLFGGETFYHFAQYNNPRLPGEESWLVKLTWSALFYPLVVLAAAGNLLVIWIIATKPLMRTVVNRFLLNLTISDFLSIFFNCGFFFYMMINEHWPFGKIYCVINNFIANLTLATSISTLSLISLDRYYAIVHPLRPRQSHRRLLLSIGAIWIFSALFSLPTLLYSDTMEVTSEERSEHVLNSTGDGWFPSALLLNVIPPPSNASLHQINNEGDFDNSVVRFSIDHPLQSTRTLCILHWPDGVSGFSKYEFIYNLAFLILFYIVPLFTMVVALVLMSRVLWPSERIGEPTLPQYALIRSKRKVVCMLFTIVCVFSVCWLPYHLYFISIYLWPNLIRTVGIKHIFLAFYFLAMSNSLLNVLILFAMNRRIRNYIIHYLKFTCCLFRLQKRFSRCRRSSLQMMMNKPNHREADSTLPNRAERSHYRQKRRAYSNGDSCTNSDEDSGRVNKNINSRHKSHSKSAQYNAVHQECSSSSANLQSNPSFRTNRKNHFLRKSLNDEAVDDDSALNHSCPPIMCRRELDSISSCSHCLCNEEHSGASTKWHAICRCGSDSGPTTRAKNASSSSMYCITQSDHNGMDKSASQEQRKRPSRFRLFSWRHKSSMRQNPALTVSTSMPSASQLPLQVKQQRRSPVEAQLNCSDRSNTAL